MHLSTSSSNDRLPDANWGIIWLGVLGAILFVILFFESHIRSLGWSPSVVDSPDLWIEQRKRATTLGEKALILVGASRMQLDMDLEVLREETRLEPVQLAIDGTSYFPVLENLANDPQITGTVLVSVNAYNMHKGTPTDTSVRWVNAYEKRRDQWVEPYRLVNNKIKAWLNNSLVTHLQGAKPYTVISKLGFSKESAGNYLITHANRSRDADYKKVKMPNFYAARLQRHFGKPVTNKAKTFEAFFATYKKAIAALPMADYSEFSKNLENLIQVSKKLEAHGANVIFIRFPTDKLVWEIDNKRYPKASFWRKIEEKHPSSIHFLDYQELEKFIAPDGSHLDYRNKSKFTRSLVKVLPLERG